MKVAHADENLVIRTLLSLADAHGGIQEVLGLSFENNGVGQVLWRHLIHLNVPYFESVKVFSLELLSS